MTAPRVKEVVSLKSTVALSSEERRWMRFGRFFDCRDLEHLADEVPFVCLALPLDGPLTSGQAFAHLPLAIKTGPSLADSLMVVAHIMIEHDVT